MDDSDIETLQIDLDRLEEWAVENAMKTNPGKLWASWEIGWRILETIFRGNQRIPVASSCK